MAYAWRGTTLVMHKSHLRQGAVILRHPLTREVVGDTKNSRDEAIRYCRRNGYSWMEPVRNVDEARREQKI